MSHDKGQPDSVQRGGNPCSQRRPARSSRRIGAVELMLLGLVLCDGAGLLLCVHARQRAAAAHGHLQPRQGSQLHHTEEAATEEGGAQRSLLSMQQGGGAGHYYTHADLVTAHPAVLGPRMVLSRVTRSWRGDVRTFVAINGSEAIAEEMNKGARRNEHYAYFPDEGKEFLGGEMWGQYVGDMRLAMTPIMAHAYYRGTYKWMLYGDDDTMFFLPAVVSLLKDYDYREPHAITDRAWFGQCLPCHFNLSDPPRGDMRGVGYSLHSPVRYRLTMPVGCPVCTPEAVCKGAGKWCQERKSAYYGGAGVLLSHGLLERLNGTAFLECLMKQPRGKKTGGDVLLSRCMWDLGYSFTDPGFMAGHRGSLNYRSFMTYWRNETDHATTPLAMMAEGKCDFRCKWQIRNRVTYHAKTQNLANDYERTAAMIASIAAQYRAAYSLLDLMQARSEQQQQQQP